MLAALGSAALIVAGSLTVGQAVLTLCGRREDRALAGPVGLALALALAAMVAGLGGRGDAVAIVLAVAVLAAAAVLVRAGLPRVGATDRLVAIAGALVAGGFAALPFLAAGTVGILGVGLVNDDMASHLLIADWIEERFRPEPVLIDQGYPLGPHALVAGLGAALGARSIDAFAGLVLAIPGLTAFAIGARFADLRPLVRVGVAAISALPYLAAAYLAQEAFKEPILALFLIGFALLLVDTRSARGAIPLGVLAAGVVYVYSFPGLAWLIGAALVLGAVVVLAGWGRSGVARTGGGAQSVPISAGKRPTPPEPRAVVAPLILALGAFGILIAPEIPRLLDFADFRALDPNRANEGGLGNLREHISALEAFGVWPASDFRITASAGEAPAIAFYTGGALAVGAFLLALPRYLRRFGAALPAALLAAAALYAVARAFGTVYTSAKALAIAAPLITLITLAGLLAPAVSSRVRVSLRGVALLLGFAVAASSFLVLRQAPVGPESHMRELAEIRPLVEGEKLLFLGRDNFVLWELRGSKPFTHVRNFYDPYYVEPNTELRDVFSKFDFDSVDAATLDGFRYVLTTRATYASGPPPSHEIAASTDSYVLWERAEPVGVRRPGERDAAPGAVARDCRSDRAAAGAVIDPGPIAVPAAAWSRPTLESGTSSTLELDLPRGRWDVSLRYDATRPITLGAGREGVFARLPGNLDYRGPAPFWAAGTLRVESDEPVGVVATVEDPPLAGELLGARSVAHLGDMAATPVAGARARAGAGPVPGAAAGPLRGAPPCGSYVDWYRP